LPVAHTGWGSPADRQLSDEAGFDLHLIKPIVYSELLRRLEEIADLASDHVLTPAQ